MRRTLGAIAVLATVSCNSAVPAARPVRARADITWRVLTNGSQARLQTSTGHAAIVRSQAELDALWDSLIGAGDPPAIDFTRDYGVILISSPKPTGGYAIAVRDITRSGTQLVVDAQVSGPPDGAMTIQVITTPFAVISVPRSDVQSVQWMR